jgi:hypothetical protein
MTRLRLLFAGATLAGAMVGLSAPASATVTVGFQEAGVNGGAITTVSTGATTAGVIGSTYGTFDINNVSGSQGVLPDLLNSNAIDQVSSGGTAGTLNVFVTYSGITSPVGTPDFISSLTSNALPSGWTVTEKTFLDPGNGVYATTDPLASFAFSAIGTNVTGDTVATGGGPYSLTEEFTINATGAGSANDTIDISAAAPEPATWMMMLFGLFGVGAVLRGTRNQRALAGI